MMSESSAMDFVRRNGKPHLLVRIGNIRGNFLLKPEASPVSVPAGQATWRTSSGAFMALMD